MRRTFPLLALALTLAGCHGRVVAYGEIDPDAVESIVRDVARLRELSVLRPVRVRLESPRALRRRVEHDVAETVASGDLARLKRALGRLRLIATDDDVEAFTRETYSSEPAGYYVTEERRLHIVARRAFRSDLGEVVGAITGRDPQYGGVLAHEITHALVDQHVDLEAFLNLAGSDDAEMARRALGEGDATRVAFLYDGGSSFAGYLTRMEDTLRALDEDRPGPTFLRDGLRFPYVEGGRFVEHLYAYGGWAAVDTAYRSPPASTEQILHPERYPADHPVAIDIPPSVAPSRQARRIFDDVLGERSVRALFARLLDTETAVRAGTGWAGDRAVVWDDGGRLSLAWWTAWDSRRDAREFAAAYLRLVESQVARRSLVDAAIGRMVWETPEGLVRIAVEGDRVQVSEGFPLGSPILGAVRR